MRKVYYGRFVDFMPPMADYDDGLIGAHIYTRHAESESLKTAGYEYYIFEPRRGFVKGIITTINDATLLEKIRARFIFLFTPKKREILGVRSDAHHNPYDDPDPQLGTKIDESGKKIVDKSYYNEKENDVLTSEMSLEHKKQKLKEIRDTLNSAYVKVEEENRSKRR